MEGMSSLEAELILLLGALRSFWSKMKPVADTRQQTNILSNKEKE